MFKKGMDSSFLERNQEWQKTQAMPSYLGSPWLERLRAHVLLRTNCGVLSALSLLPAWSWATFWVALQDFLIYFPQGSMFPFTLYFGVLTVIISACLKHTWSPNWQISWDQTLLAWLRSYSWQQLTWNTTNWNVLSTSSFACLLAFFFFK